MIWGDAFVEADGGLNYCIRQVRSALGERAAAPRYIETVRRSGYRFIAPVTAGTEPLMAGYIQANPEPSSGDERTEWLPERWALLIPAASQRRLRRRAAALAVLGAGVMIALFSNRAVPNGAGASGRAVTEAADVDTSSLARLRDDRLREAWLAAEYHLAEGGREHRLRAQARLYEILRIDRTDAAAWAALARTYLGPGSEPADSARAEAAADQALTLDPDLAEGYVAKATLALFRRWDFAAAGRYFERAIELAPSSHHVRISVASYYSVVGRHGEAIALVETVLQEDPIKPRIRGDIGWFYYWARRYDDAVLQCTKTLRLAPEHRPAMRCLLQAYIATGALSEARDVAHRLARIEGASHTWREAIALPTAAAGLNQYWRWQAQRRPPGAAPATQQALAHAALGEQAAALRLLEQARAERSPMLLYSRHDALLDSLRATSAFGHLDVDVGVEDQEHPSASLATPSAS